MQVNSQLPERIDRRDNGYLIVHSIWKTIQGEGPFAGSPAVFIRLAGCNLQCRLCDTDYTSVKMNLGPYEVLEQVSLTRGETPLDLVVITGGEPFRQNLGPLVDVLYDEGYRVQVETNGTLYPVNLTPDRCTIVCSPKTPRIHHEIAPLVSAWKYVVEMGKVSIEDGLPNGVLGEDIPVARPPFKTPKDCIYVQPLDEQDEELNKMHYQAAVSSCMGFGYRLCLQMQKIVGLP